MPRKSAFFFEASTSGVCKGSSWRCSRCWCCSGSCAFGFSSLGQGSERWAMGSCIFDDSEPKKLRSPTARWFPFKSVSSSNLICIDCAETHSILLLGKNGQTSRKINFFFGLYRALLSSLRPIPHIRWCSMTLKVQGWQALGWTQGEELSHVI